LNKAKVPEEVKRMKKYEVMFIIRPAVEEEARKSLIDEMSSIFTNNGSTVLDVNTKDWGMRDLAYTIKGETKGFYVLMNVEATPAAISEFNRIANIKETLIRHIIVVNE
jgi:small subunit ribosomal protein S6